MFKKILIGMSLLLVVGLLAGCGGVSQDDYDAAKAQISSLQSQLNTANGKVTSLQSQADAANTAKSQAEANKALVRRYYETINSGNLSALDQILAPDYKRYLTATGTSLDAAAQKKRLAGMRSVVFPDLQITVDNVIVEGDYIAVSMTVRGTQKGPFSGIPPTGKSVVVSAFEVIRIQNGKFVEHWGGTDNLDLLQQLGAVISAGK